MLLALSSSSANICSWAELSFATPLRPFSSLKGSGKWVMCGVKQPTSPGVDSLSILFNHCSFQKPAVSPEFLEVLWKEGSLERIGKVPIEQSTKRLNKWKLSNKYNSGHLPILGTTPHLLWILHSPEVENCSFSGRPLRHKNGIHTGNPTLRRRLVLETGPTMSPVIPVIPFTSRLKVGTHESHAHKKRVQMVNSNSRPYLVCINSTLSEPPPTPPSARAWRPPKTPNTPSLASKTRKHFKPLLGGFLLPCEKFNLQWFHGKPTSWQQAKVLTSLGKMHSSLHFELQPSTQTASDSTQAGASRSAARDFSACASSWPRCTNAARSSSVSRDSSRASLRASPERASEPRTREGAAKEPLLGGKRNLHPRFFFGWTA